MPHNTPPHKTNMCKMTNMCKITYFGVQNGKCKANLHFVCRAVFARFKLLGPDRPAFSIPYPNNLLGFGAWMLWRERIPMPNALEIAICCVLGGGVLDTSSSLLMPSALWIATRCVLECLGHFLMLKCIGDCYTLCLGGCLGHVLMPNDWRL